MTTVSTPIPQSVTFPKFNDAVTNLEAGLGKGNRMTVKHLASDFNVSIAQMRKALIAHYGNRIAFTKGRTGGIVLKA